MLQNLVEVSSSHLGLGSFSYTLFLKYYQNVPLVFEPMTVMPNYGCVHVKVLPIFINHIFPPKAINHLCTIRGCNT